MMVFAGCLYPEGEGAGTLCKTEHSHNIHVVPLDVTSDQSVTDAIQIMKKHPRFKGQVTPILFNSVYFSKLIEQVDLTGLIGGSTVDILVFQIILLLFPVIPW